MPIQTTYTLTPDQAVAGQLESYFGEADIISVIAGEDIPYGRAVEFNQTNKVGVLPKSTTIGNIAGIVLYPVTNDPLVFSGTPTTNAFGYKAGQTMAVLRRGRVWMELQSTATPVTFNAGNVMHASSDVSSNLRHRGKITADATSVTAGAEISSPASVVIRFQILPSTNPSGLYLVGISAS